MLRRTSLFIVFVLIASQASAAFITDNDPSITGTTRDGFNLTIDTDTGLKWLDINLAVNRSYADVSAQFGPGGDFEGYRHATASELLTFFGNHGVPVNDHVPGYDAFLKGITALELIGFTVNVTESIGYFDDTANPDSGPIGRASITGFPVMPFGDGSGGSFVESGSYSGEASEDIGHWLVASTSMPEPSTYAALASLALVGLAAYRRQRRRSTGG